MAKPRLALSIRQPFAELILRGEKTIEERSRPTRVRGIVYLYASMGRYPRAEEAEWAEEFGLDIAGLPRGVLVGLVDLYDCQGNGEWLFRAPERLAKPMKAERHPQPVWFRPFG
jgi:hypothetical protein